MTVFWANIVYTGEIVLKEFVKSLIRFDSISFFFLIEIYKTGQTVQSVLIIYFLICFAVLYDLRVVCNPHLMNFSLTLLFNNYESIFWSNDQTTNSILAETLQNVYFGPKYVPEKTV